jgi:hypothetical protein
LNNEYVEVGIRRHARDGNVHDLDWTDGADCDVAMRLGRDGRKIDQSMRAYELEVNESPKSNCIVIDSILIIGSNRFCSVRVLLTPSGGWEPDLRRVEGARE